MSRDGSSATKSPPAGWQGPLLLLMLLLIVLGLAATIPYFYQSQTILYKFGTDKILLRAGKVAGVLAATLLLLQIVPVARLGLLESFVSRRNLLRFHQLSGMLLVILALLHPLLVFWPEDLAALAVEWRFWPEIIGAGLLLLIWIVVAIAKMRSFLRLSGPAWMRLHRILVNVAAGGVLIHTLSVSDTFEQSVPRLAVFGLAAVYAAVWFKLRLLSLRRQRQLSTTANPAHPVSNRES